MYVDMLCLKNEKHEKEIQGTLILVLPVFKKCGNCSLNTGILERNS